MDISTSGATAVACLIFRDVNGNRLLYTANVGDSRAVLCSTKFNGEPACTSRYGFIVSICVPVTLHKAAALLLASPSITVRKMKENSSVLKMLVVSLHDQGMETLS